MYEHEDTYVEVVKYVLDGTNTLILIKHKHKVHTNE